MVKSHLTNSRRFSLRSTDPILSLSTLILLGSLCILEKEKLDTIWDSSGFLSLVAGSISKTDRHGVGSEFTQLMKGLQGERLRQAFHHFDKNQDGYIDPEDFQKIIVDLSRHKLSEAVLKQLPELSRFTSPGGKVSYSECIAFHNVCQLSFSLT